MIRRETYIFAQDVDPGATGNIQHRLPYDGIIRRCELRWYPGAKLQLKLQPMVIRRPDTPEALVHVAGRSTAWLAGDDDLLRFDLAIPVRQDDVLQVQYDNDDVLTVHSFFVLVEVDYL